MENNNELTHNSVQQDLLAEESYDLNSYVYATQWQRFVNWLIDNLLMRFGLSYLTGIVIGTMLGLIAPEFISNIANDGAMSSGIFLLSFMIGYLNYIVYYTLCEKLFKGYTLGKIITGTRAIRQDGQELTLKNALLRSLSRCVPFEVFSGFNTLTWHDSWTDTMVVKIKIDFTPVSAATILLLHPNSSLFFRHNLLIDRVQFYPHQNIYFRGVQNTSLKPMMPDT